MKLVRCAVILLSYSLLSYSPAFSEFVPAGEFRFLGGQYFFNNDPSSLSGILSLTLVPAMKINDKISVIPAYMGTYRGTQEVNDLAGGGTLFQDGQSHLTSVKAVYALMPALKLKAGGSYRMEYLRETKDETWGQGLFDYTKTNFGFEAEYEYLKSQSVRVGIDSFALKFPNYESLESSAAAGGLGRELAGKNTLDCNNMMTSFYFDNAYGALKTGVSINMTSKDYSDQPIINADSSYSSEKRKDTFMAVGIGGAYPFKLAQDLRLLTSLDLQMISNDSTQGHYDARKVQYTGDYYDYSITGIAPSFNFILGDDNPWAVSLGFNMNSQVYKERLAQNSDESYTGDKIYVNQTVYTLGVTYPVTRNIKLRVLSSYIEAKSNMKFENTYAYNYTTSNYLFGFGYEF